MKHIKYITLSLLTLGMLSCENETVQELRDQANQNDGPLPELVAGEADFSNFVAVGASFTAGFTDNALFMASQENSFPNIMATQFAKVGGGSFNQPLMNGNLGGLKLGSMRLTDPRLVFGGAGPVPIESVIGPVTVMTDITNNPAGPFNNLGIPGAKSFHLVAPGYGNIQNLPNANPYAVRVTGNAPNASIVELAVAQNPTFFTLSEVGGNDVLGYATSGGDGSNPITPTAMFDGALNAMVAALTANGAKGAIGNLPNITSLSFFTTVPFNSLDPSLPALAPQIDALNAQLYEPLDGIFTAFGEPDRLNPLSKTAANPLLINDENAPDRTAQITGALTPVLGPQTAAAFGQIFGKARQATANDLILLTASTAIATTVPGVPAPANVNGVSFPMADNLVLTPEEQTEIATATQAYNSSLSAAANANNLALVDLNSILVEASTTGIEFDDYFLNTDLVFGGLVSLDGVHLTARGYALMANSFLKAIDATYGSNFEASGNLAEAGDFPTNYSPTLQ
ncbi:SGNH/GDSL hydrolase family protein [Winogradskyella ursingii]|uniref:G-D-S-L family lipolytic protein n=1 Tax=Winogradskyella ursingii TaxID=2686079 RepID=UPI0015CD1C52|nr:G-D-S-L family lipolytic protein [Winogradskyella ursingii]